MLTLSSVAIAEKNKLSSAGAWLVLLDIVLTDGVTHIRLIRNTEDKVWPTIGGNTYQKFPFEIDDTREDKGGEHNVLNIRVGNATRALMPYLEDEKGMVGCAVTLYVVHSDHLNLTTAEINETFIITSSSANSLWVTFELSSRNLFNVQFPDNRYIRNWCRFKFNYPEERDYRCGYIGGAFTDCNKTLANCRARGNSVNFGGFPGIPEGGLYIANA
uniref:Putative tail protein n=1 Tax=viral metagenome TaxID=1070528 RepID=A0A6M3IJ73_9ZZZZ